MLITRTSSCYGRLNLLNTAIGHIKEIGPSNDISKEAFSVSCHVCNISGREFITPNVHLTHFADKSFVSTKVGCHSVLFLSKNKRPSCCDNLENKKKNQNLHQVQLFCQAFEIIWLKHLDDLPCFLKRIVIPSLHTSLLKYFSWWKTPRRCKR